VKLTVNSEELTTDAVDGVLRELAAQDRAFAALEPTEQRERAEVALIERVLVRQAAATEGPDIRAVDVKREVKRAVQNAGGQEAFGRYLEATGLTMAAVESDVELRLKIDGLLDQICGAVARPDDGACRAYYDANPENFRTEEHVRASHIIIHDTGNVVDEHAAREELGRIRREIAAGKPFEYFTGGCTDCGDDHGDLGYFGRGTMVPEFDEVVFALKPGEVSEVFKSRFGFHLVKLLDHIPAKPREFDDVKEEVRQFLFDQAENACIDAFTASLKERATITRSE